MKNKTQEKYAASKLVRHRADLATRTHVLYQFLKQQRSETPKWKEDNIRDFVLWKYNYRYIPKATHEDYETVKKIIENE